MKGRTKDRRINGATFIHEELTTEMLISGEQNPISML